VRVPPPAATGVQSGSSHTLEGASRGEVHEPAEAGHGATRGPATAVPPVPHGGGNGNGERWFASPLAPAHRADRGSTFGNPGHRPAGRVVQRDVFAYAERPPAAARPARCAWGRPVAAADCSRANGSRPAQQNAAAIATAPQRSKQQVPHFYVTVDVDVEALTACGRG